MTELAKRAVASKHWRWMPGMRTTADERLGPFLAPGFPIFDEDGAPEWLLPQDVERLSDLDDPATLGCLLALVREAWGNRTAYAYFYRNAGPQWCCHVSPGVDFWADTEAKALVAALEAAP